jgi:hypothetical protein
MVRREALRQFFGGNWHTVSRRGRRMEVVERVRAEEISDDPWDEREVVTSRSLVDVLVSRELRSVLAFGY